MNIYMLKDVENVGMAGAAVEVADGYAANYLIPQGFAKKLSAAELKNFKAKSAGKSVSKELLNSKAAMIAERIKNLKVTLKTKVHDENKLYGSISAEDIVALLKEKDISISKKQVEFNKSIKTVGEHKVFIKLSSKLKPELTVNVVSNK